MISLQLAPNTNRMRREPRMLIGQNVRNNDYQPRKNSRFRHSMKNMEFRMPDYDFPNTFKN